MTVQRLAEGLWRWTAAHPEWREGDDWGRAVGSVYCETPEAVVVFDPLVPAEGGDVDRFWDALDRDVARLALPVVVLLTCSWHVRSAADVRDRYSASVWAPPAGGEGLEGLVSDVLGDGGWPVDGVQAFLMGAPPGPSEEAAYWIPSHRAIVLGDLLIGDGAGGVRLAPAEWYSDSPAERDRFRTDVVTSLERLAASCDPSLLLPAHGDPVTAGAAAALRASLVGM